MKKLIVLVIILISLPLFSQEIKIYETNKYGLKSLYPSTIIVKEGNNTYNEYKVNRYGLKKLYPNRTIIVDNDNELPILPNNGSNNSFPIRLITKDSI